jgi:hypothetical protein
MGASSGHQFSSSVWVPHDTWQHCVTGTWGAKPETQYIHCLVRSVAWEHATRRALATGHSVYNIGCCQLPGASLMQDVCLYCHLVLQEQAGGSAGSQAS